MRCSLDQMVVTALALYNSGMAFMPCLRVFVYLIRFDCLLFFQNRIVAFKFDSFLVDLHLMEHRREAQPSHRLQSKIVCLFIP